MEFNNLKEEAFKQVEQRCKLSEWYNKGLKDGYVEGYETAIKHTQKVISKYNLGNGKDEEKDLIPAFKFMGDSMRSLIDKIVEECGEVVEAWNDGETKDRVAEEIGDVQLACETALAGLGYHEKERRGVRLKNIKKNKDRGYYCDKVSADNVE
jgi:phosphoribosyl-ATP pyrophosphohydrolase